jgi:hypothetical protein
MKTLKERAKSYVKQVKPNNPLACEFDYLAGATEEHNHLCKWHKATDEQPEVGEKVLVKLANGDYAIGIYRADNLWSLAGSGVLPSNEHISWRYIE